MRRIKRRTLFGIGIYSILVTLGILGCLYAFLLQQPTPKHPAMFKRIDLTSDLKETFASSNQLDSIGFTTSNLLNQLYSKDILNMFPYILLSIIAIILCSSIILWFWLRKGELQQQKRINFDLKKLLSANEQEACDFQETYRDIRHQFQQYEQDQQRIHAYITHEQKNMIMIMKARLDQQKDHVLLQDMNKLKDSVEDILTLSSHQDTEQEVVDISLIVANACDMYRMSYSLLDFQFDEFKDFFMMGKEHWIRRLIDNLIDNAIKFGEHQKIEVILKQVHNSIILIVKDHGRGMDVKQQAAIFEYRYRIHHLNNDGYGIGLSLVKHVCELCDGVIWVKSALGQGSTIQLSFPLYVKP